MYDNDLCRSNIIPLWGLKQYCQTGCSHIVTYVLNFQTASQSREYDDVDSLTKL